MDQKANAPPTILTAEDVAKIFLVDVRTVYRMARNGEIPCIHFGRSIRFSSEELDSWMHRHE